MIREALEYIVSLRKPELLDVGGEKYTDKQLSRIEPVIIRSREEVTFGTLTSLVDYVRSQVERDNLYRYDELYIHIKSPVEVAVFEKDNILDGVKTRICRAIADLPQIQYGYFYDSESFNILLQSRICSTQESKELLAIVGNVKTSDVQTSSDNGVTQTVQTNKGVVLKENTELPNPVVLAPFRTFVEIDQVCSPFVLRARESETHDDSKGVSFALFEADGGAWKITATERIKAALEKAFADSGVIILA